MMFALFLMQIKTTCLDFATLEENKECRMKPTKTWILIADATKARILENAGPGKGLSQLGDQVFKARERKDHSDDQGRTYNSVSPARHKMETNVTDDVVHLEHVDEILSSLGGALSARRFDRLLICAAPQTLGVIRQRIPEALNAVVMAEVAKDLTRTPTDELADHFVDLLIV